VASKQTGDLLRAQLNKDVSLPSTNLYKPPATNQPQPPATAIATTPPKWLPPNVHCLSTSLPEIERVVKSTFPPSDPPNMNTNHGTALRMAESNALISATNLTHVHSSGENLVFSLASPTPNEIINNNVFPYFSQSNISVNNSSSLSSSDNLYRNLPYDVNKESALVNPYLTDKILPSGIRQDGAHNHPTEGNTSFVHLGRKTPSKLGKVFDI